MSKEYSRRAFIGLGLTAAAGALAGCGKELKLVDVTPTPAPVVAADKVEALRKLSANVTATPIVKEDYWAKDYSHSADHEGNVWTLHNSDGAEVKVSLNKVTGFTPDADLKTSDISPKTLGTVPTDASDFQAYLNKPREGFGPLAGYTDGTNDYNQYKDHESGPQVPAYSWMVHTGLDVELPGIGRVVGGPGRAAMVLIINRTERVYRFPTNSVRVEAGFQGWGRIWNGDRDPVQETELRLANHYRSRLGQGVPETGFIGQCDQAGKNCDTISIVTVERMQWGNNDNGTPRDQFRLIRAETVPAVK
jgi:hypothetical protein